VLFGGGSEWDYKDPLSKAETMQVGRKFPESLASTREYVPAFGHVFH
jgi:hypothetical protein